MSYSVEEGVTMAMFAASGWAGVGAVAAVAVVVMEEGTVAGATDDGGTALEAVDMLEGRTLRCWTRCFRALVSSVMLLAAVFCAEF